MSGTWGAGAWGSGTWGGTGGGGYAQYPDARVFIAFDVDPLVLGGIITGDDSTCEALGDWTAAANTTLDLNDATSRVAAGLHCLRLAAVADGDVGVTITGLGSGSVVPGRPYLLWAHARAETASRQCRATIRWRSASGVALTSSASALIDDSTDAYVRLGVLAYAPPGADQLDIAIDVLDADAGEIHYVDVVTVDYVGTDVSDFVGPWSCALSGRNQTLGTTDSGNATIQFDNPDGRFTPGRATTSLAPYAGNIVPRRRVWIVATWAGVLYPVWSGYTRRWVQADVKRDSWSTVKLSCDDGFRWLTGSPVPAAYRAEVLADGPLSLYPLDEQSDSASASDLVAAVPALLLANPTGNGKSAFGATTVLPVTVAGENTDGGATALGFNLEPDDLGDMGCVLDLRFAGGMPPQLFFSPWTMEFWFAYQGVSSPPAFTQILFRHLVAADGLDFLSGFQILLLTTGQLQVVTGGSETVATTAGSLADGGPHHVVLTYEAGGANGVATLWVDGVEVGALTLTTTPFVAGLPTNAQFGGAIATINRGASFLFTGRASHIAFYYQLLADDRIAAHYTAGADGFYQETDGDRVTAILRFAGWPDEDTAIDKGLTRLVPRDWSPGNGLALVQDVCAYSGATPVMDARGALRVLNRHRFVNEVRILAYFAGSAGTEPEAADYSPWLDDSRIENVIEVDRAGGRPVVVEDAESIARYGAIKGTAIPSGAASDSESVHHAQWRLTRTAEPHARIDTMTWRPDASATGALWPLILPRQFGDRVLVGELPDPAAIPGPDGTPGALASPVSVAVTPLVTGAGTEYDALIGRVSHASDGRSWVTRFTLEPALIDQMGVCDHPVYGIADTPQCVAGY